MSPIIGDSLPARPFFSCEEDAFVIVDSASMSAGFKSGTFDPWFRFEVGSRNVFESRPVKVLSHSSDKALVECTVGTVELDFESGSARKRSPDGKEWVYLAGLDEANSGGGWMRVS